MKHTNDFAEIAQIFTVIAKAEEAAKNYETAYAEYRKLSEQFNGIYSEQREIADAMIAKWDEVEKFDKKFRKYAKQAVELMDLNSEKYEEESSCKTDIYNWRRWVYSTKYLAMKLVSRVEI